MQTMMSFNLEKLEDSHILDDFQTTLRIFAPHSILEGDEIDIDMMASTFRTVVTETATDILGKHWPKKKLWVTTEVL